MADSFQNEVPASVSVQEKPDADVGVSTVSLKHCKAGRSGLEEDYIVQCYVAKRRACSGTV